MVAIYNKAFTGCCTTNVSESTYVNQLTAMCTSPGERRLWEAGGGGGGDRILRQTSSPFCIPVVQEL